MVACLLQAHADWKIHTPSHDSCAYTGLTIVDFEP